MKKEDNPLRKYGEHLSSCEVPCYDRGQKTHDSCTCGLTAAIKELEATK